MMRKRQKWVLALVLLCLVVSGLLWHNRGQWCSAGRLHTYTERVWRYEPRPGNNLQQALGRLVEGMSPSSKRTYREHALNWEDGKLYWAYSSRTLLWFSFGEHVLESPPRDISYWQFAISPTNELEQSLAALPNLSFHGGEWSGWPKLLGKNISTNAHGGGSIRIAQGGIFFARHVTNQHRCYLVQVEKIHLGPWGDSQIALRHIPIVLPNQAEAVTRKSTVK